MGLDSFAVCRREVKKLHAHAHPGDRIGDFGDRNDRGPIVVEVESQVEFHAQWQWVLGLNKHPAFADVPGESECHAVLRLNLGRERSAGEIPPIAGLAMDHAQENLKLVGRQAHKLERYAAAPQYIADPGLRFDLGEVLCGPEPGVDFSPLSKRPVGVKKKSSPTEGRGPRGKSLVADRAIHTELCSYAGILPSLLRLQRQNQLPHWDVQNCSYSTTQN